MIGNQANATAMNNSYLLGATCASSGMPSPTAPVMQACDSLDQMINMLADRAHILRCRIGVVSLKLGKDETKGSDRVQGSCELEERLLGFNDRISALYASINEAIDLLCI